jgi:peptidoglycan hydrolase-like protein with peptidoglycan-binding domain
MAKRVWGLPDLPSFMQQGSRGPLVNLVIVLFAGWAAGWRPKPSGLVVDHQYGPTLAKVVTMFQEYRDLEDVDGNCGPATRGAMAQEFGLDFLDLARLCGSNEPTIFMQLDGSEVAWTLNPPQDS